MTELLDQAVEKVQALPPETQDRAARILLIYAGDDEAVVESTPEEEADLIEARAEMERGEFATEAGVQAVLSNYRLRGFGTPSALQQMDETLGYIAVRSPRGAAKVQRRITTILALLQVQPSWAAGRVCPACVACS